MGQLFYGQFDILYTHPYIRYVNKHAFGGGGDVIFGVYPWLEANNTTMYYTVVKHLDTLLEHNAHVSTTPGMLPVMLYCMV